MGTILIPIIATTDEVDAQVYIYYLFYYYFIIIVGTILIPIIATTHEVDAQVYIYIYILILLLFNTYYCYNI